MSEILQNLDWSVLTGILLSIIPVLFCITIHELAHGITAYWLGDRTAKDMGRLTLNPIKHIEIFGLLMMAVFGFGWAKPVPINMMNFKRPKRYMAVTAIAGPVSNLILAVFILIIFGLLYTPLGGMYASQGSASGIALAMIQRTAYLSVALAVFNMIPIPPLDGSKVLFSLVSDKTYYKLMRYERYGMILLILFVSTAFFSSTVGFAVTNLFDRLLVIAQTAYNLVN